MGFILITIVIIAALSMFSGNKTKKSTKVNQEQMKFERKMKKEFNEGTRESSSQAYHIDLAETWSPKKVKNYS